MKRFVWMCVGGTAFLGPGSNSFKMGFVSPPAAIEPRYNAILSSGSRRVRTQPSPVNTFLFKSRSSMFNACSVAFSRSTTYVHVPSFIERVDKLCLRIEMVFVYRSSISISCTPSRACKAILAPRPSG